MLAHVTFTDLAVVLVVLASTGYAVVRGFLWEALTMFAWIAALLGCVYLGPAIVPPIRRMVAAPWLAELVGYAAMFLLVLIPLAILGNGIAKKMSGSPIRPLDRVLGGALGAIRGVAIVGLAYIAFSWFVPVLRQPGWLAGAATLPAIQATGEILLSLLPEQDHPDFARAPAPGEFIHDDLLGDLIRCGQAGGHQSCYRNGAVMKAPGVLEK